MFSHYRTRNKLFLAAALLIAQGEERFKVRFTPVPMDAAMRATVAGSGSGTATLSGNKLTINVTFSGMPSAATTASERANTGSEPARVRWTASTCGAGV